MLYRGSTPGQSDEVRIAYAAPAISQIYARASSTEPWVEQSSGSDLDLVPARISTVGGEIRLVGSNLGVAPRVQHGSNAAEAAWILQGNMTTTRGFGGAAAISRSHTEIVFSIGAGIGNGVEETGSPRGYVLDLTIGDQSPSVAPRLWYELPTVTSIQTAPRPTVGGNLLIIEGANLGPTDSLDLPVVLIGGRPCTDVERVTSHTRLTCVAPAGTGRNLDIDIEVAGQTGTAPSMYSYNPPIITGVSIDRAAADSRAVGSSDFGGPAAGGYNISIEGTDFGDPSIAGTPGTDRGICIFLPSLRDEELLCDGRLSSPWEGEVWSGRIMLHSASRIVANVPPGMGNARFVLYVAGHMVTLQADVLGDDDQGQPRAFQDDTGNALFTYDAPQIVTMEPGRGSTSGGNTILLRGSGFGWGSTSVLNGQRNSTEGSPRGRVLQSANPYADGGPVLPLSIPPLDGDSVEEMGRAFAFPPAFMVRVDFAQGCVSSAVTPLTASPPLAFDELTDCSRETDGFGVVMHTDTELSFVSLPGIGRDKEVRVTVVGPDGRVVARSNSVPWSFDPPVITEIRPNVLRMEEHPWLAQDGTGIVTPDGFGDQMTAVEVEDSRRERSSQLTIAGRNFGPLDTRDWTEDERVLEVWVDGRPCHNPIRSLDTRGSLISDDAALTTQQIVTCSLEWLEVGYKSINITVAGQTSSPSPSFALETVCAAGFYGQPGEYCVSCPVGATCDGYSDRFSGFTNNTLPLLYQDGEPSPSDAA